jgi:hypothetical protein
MTELKIPAPPGARRRGLSVVESMQPAVPQTVPDNLSKPATGLQDLNFKVDNDFHRTFKLAATLKGMSMKELLEGSFAAWVERYGDDQIRALFEALKK